MKTLRIHKVLAALALLVFFTFGTASLAHELDTIGSLAQSDVRNCVKRAPAQIDPDDLTITVPFDTCHRPRGSTAELAPQRVCDVRPVQPIRARVRPYTRTGKPAIDIYDSVLLL